MFACAREMPRILCQSSSLVEDGLLTNNVGSKVSVQQVQTHHLSTKVCTRESVDNDGSDDRNAACNDSDKASAIVPFRSDERKYEGCKCRHYTRGHGEERRIYA